MAFGHELKYAFRFRGVTSGGNRQCAGDVIGRWLSQHQLKHPHPALCPAHGYPLAGNQRRHVREAHDRSALADPGIDACRKALQATVGVEVRKRHGDSKLLVHTARQSHGDQRMTSEVEEVRVTMLHICAEQFRPERSEPSFCGGGQWQPFVPFALLLGDGS